MPVVLEVGFFIVPHRYKNYLYQYGNTFFSLCSSSLYVMVGANVKSNIWKVLPLSDSSQVINMCVIYSSPRPCVCVCIYVTADLEENWPARLLLIADSPLAVLDRTTYIWVTLILKNLYNSSPLKTSNDCAVSLKTVWDCDELAVLQWRSVIHSVGRTGTFIRYSFSGTYGAFYGKWLLDCETTAVTQRLQNEDEERWKSLVS